MEKRKTKAKMKTKKRPRPASGKTCVQISADTAEAIDRLRSVMAAADPMDREPGRHAAIAYAIAHLLTAIDTPKRRSTRKASAA